MLLFESCAIFQVRKECDSSKTMLGWSYPFAKVLALFHRNKCDAKSRKNRGTSLKLCKEKFYQRLVDQRQPLLPHEDLLPVACVVSFV